MLPFLSTLEQLAVGAAEFKSWKLAHVVGPKAELYLQVEVHFISLCKQRSSSM